MQSRRVQSEALEPPSIARSLPSLVPPLTGRIRCPQGRSRFAKSGFDRQFAKPQLRQLFGDYFADDLQAVLVRGAAESDKI